MAAQRSLFFFFFTRNWPWKSGNFWKIEKNRRSAIWPILLAALSTQGGFSKLLSAQGPPGPLPLETLIRIPPLHESRNSSKISRSQTVTSFRHFQGLTMVTLFLILWNFVSIRKNIVPIQIDVRISKTLLPRVHRTSLIDVLLHHTTTWHKAQRTGRSVQGLDLLDFSTGLNFFLRRCGHPKRMKDVLSSSKSQCIPFTHPGGGGEIGVSKNPRRPNFLAQYADAYKVSWTPNTNRRNIGWVNFVFNTAIPLSNRTPYKQHSPIPWCPLTVSQCFLSREVKVFFFPFHWSTCLFTWMKPLDCTYDVRGLWRHNYVDSNFQGWYVDSHYR